MDLVQSQKLDDHSVHSSSKKALMGILFIVNPNGTDGHSVHSSSKKELMGILFIVHPKWN
jgi:hypothetical protein